MKRHIVAPIVAIVAVGLLATACSSDGGSSEDDGIAGTGNGDATQSEGEGEGATRTPRTTAKRARRRRGTTSSVRSSNCPRTWSMSSRTPRPVTLSRTPSSPTS
jgi:hypothetical protein